MNEDASASLHDAFISYSRRDKEFANRLGVALRAYKPPKGMGVTQRHIDVFRDEEDFTGVEYHEAVRKHLGASSHLVLICSPHARKSEYVNDEIRQFVAARGADRIIPIIVSGLANNEARDDQDGEKAFPEALCEALRMPLAIDYRGFDPGGKQKVQKEPFLAAWCSLLANLYGLSRSDIEQREKKRETRRRRTVQGIVGGVMATLLAATAVSLVFWRQAVVQRTAAVARQLAAQAELTRNQSAQFIERSVLLSAESMKRLPTVEAEMVLRPQLAMLLQPTRRISMGGETGDYLFSADGKLVAAATADGVKIYDLASGKQISVLHPEPPMMEYEFSPDGEHFATGSGAMNPQLPPNYLAQVWRIRDGAEVARLPYTEPVEKLAFSADGRYLATADGKFARVWEWAGQPLLRREFELDAHLLDVALSPDGGRLFTQTNMKINQVRDVGTGAVLENLQFSEGQFHIAFSPDWNRIATSSDDSIRITELESGAEIARILEPGTSAPAFLEHGELLMASGDNASTIVWDVKGNYDLFRVRDARRLVVSPDREYAATLNDAGLVQIWADTDQEVSRVYDRGFLSMAFVAGGKLLATGDSSGSLQLWEMTAGREVARLPHDDSIEFIAYTPDGKYLVTNCGDRVVRVWDVAGSREIARIPTEYGARGVALDPVDGKRLVVSVDSGTRTYETLTGKDITAPNTIQGMHRGVFSRDGKSLATIGTNNDVRLWDMSSGREIAPPLPLGDGIAWLILSPDGRRIVATTINSDIAVVWDPATNKVVARFKEDGGYGRVAYSPDGRFVAAGVSAQNVGHGPVPTLVGGGAVVLWDTQTWKEARRLKDAGTVLAFSPDGSLLATTGVQSNVLIWDVDSGKELAQLPHRGQIMDGEFTPDGASFLTASVDGARAWDPVTGREISRMQSASPILVLAVSPDSRYLSTGDEEGVVRTWFLRPDDLIAEACKRLTRNLTREEWREYMGSEPYVPTCPAK